MRGGLAGVQGSCCFDFRAGSMEVVTLCSSDPILIPNSISSLEVEPIYSPSYSAESLIADYAKLNRGVLHFK